MCDARGDSCTDCVALFIDCLLRSEAGSFIKYWATFQLELSKCEWGLLTWKRDDPSAHRNPQTPDPVLKPASNAPLMKCIINTFCLPSPPELFVWMFTSKGKREDRTLLSGSSWREETLLDRRVCFLEKRGLLYFQRFSFSGRILVIGIKK